MNIVARLTENDKNYVGKQITCFWQRQCFCFWCEFAKWRPFCFVRQMQNNTIWIPQIFERKEFCSTSTELMWIENYHLRKSSNEYRSRFEFSQEIHYKIDTRNQVLLNTLRFLFEQKKRSSIYCKSNYTVNHIIF